MAMEIYGDEYKTIVMMQMMMISYEISYYFTCFNNDTCYDNNHGNK